MLHKAEDDKENTPVRSEQPSTASSPSHNCTAEVSSARGPYVILLLGMVEEEKTLRYKKIIDELGGTMTDAPTFDPLITHVVSSRPSRSERHLAAVAAGKWLLLESFLDESSKRGEFVEVSECSGSP